MKTWTPCAPRVVLSGRSPLVRSKRPRCTTLAALVRPSSSPRREHRARTHRRLCLEVLARLTAFQSGRVRGKRASVVGRVVADRDLDFGLCQSRSTRDAIAIRSNVVRTMCVSFDGFFLLLCNLRGRDSVETTRCVVSRLRMWCVFFCACEFCFVFVWVCITEMNVISRTNVARAIGTT